MSSRLYKIFFISLLVKLGLSALIPLTNDEALLLGLVTKHAVEFLRSSAGGGVAVLVGPKVPLLAGNGEMAWRLAWPLYVGPLAFDSAAVPQ